jgi:hypothetical protein
MYFDPALCERKRYSARADAQLKRAATLRQRGQELGHRIDIFDLAVEIVVDVGDSLSISVTTRNDLRA